MTDDPRTTEEPDPRLLWRWVAKAARPWVGWVFIVLGAFLVLLGYLGVSREAIVEKQIPYLVSGGIGGVLLCVVGAYFLGTEELRKDSGRLDRLELMVAELHTALLARPDAPRPTSGGAREAGASEDGGDDAGAGPFVAVDGGETVHTPGCPMVEGKATTTLDAATATAGGLRPCPLCEPAFAAAN